MIGQQHGIVLSHIGQNTVRHRLCARQRIRRRIHLPQLQRYRRQQRLRQSHAGAGQRRSGNGVSMHRRLCQGIIPIDT